MITVGFLQPEHCGSDIEPQPEGHAKYGGDFVVTASRLRPHLVHGHRDNFQALHVWQERANVLTQLAENTLASCRYLARAGRIINRD